MLDTDSGRQNTSGQKDGLKNSYWHLLIKSEWDSLSPESDNYIKLGGNFVSLWTGSQKTLSTHLSLLRRCTMGGERTHSIWECCILLVAEKCWPHWSFSYTQTYLKKIINYTECVKVNLIHCQSTQLSSFPQSLPLTSTRSSSKDEHSRKMFLRTLPHENVSDWLRHIRSGTGRSL